MRAGRWEGGRAGLALRLGVTVAALALVVRALGAGAILEHLRAASPGWLALAVAALSLQIVLSAWRWQVTAGALGLPLGRRLALREYWLAVLGNTLLPGGVLGDLGRAARLGARTGLGRAAETVVIERLAGQVALGVVAGLGVALWFGGAGLALGAALATATGAVALIRAGSPSAADRGWFLRGLGRLHRAWLAPGVWPGQLGLSLAVLACNLLGFWAAAQAVGLQIPPTVAIFVLPLTLSAMLIPVSVNGWGLREGVAAALWPAAGLSAAGAVAASVVFGIAALLAALPGLIALRGARQPAWNRR